MRCEHCLNEQLRGLVVLMMLLPLFFPLDHTDGVQAVERLLVDSLFCSVSSTVFTTP